MSTFINLVVLAYHIALGHPLVLDAETNSFRRATPEEIKLMEETK